MARNKDAYLTMNSDDERAARVLTLAVKFFGSRLPIASSDIRTELYPTLDQGSFQRQYLRDRELLTSMGIVIREAAGDGSQPFWKIDEDASYAQAEGLGEDDARMLYVLCYDMVFDQAFPYRDELRMALAKISQMYRGSTIVRTDTSSAREHKNLGILVNSMSKRHAVEVTYTDARGNTSTRMLAILGSFGLWDKTYFVASRVNKLGMLLPDSLRTYRLDRFGRVTARNGISYHIPLDFSVSDYERLPFQIGDVCGQARLDIGDHPGHNVTRATTTQGTLLEDGTWQVAYSDVHDLASWCVGSDVIPLEPVELVEAWQQVRTDAANTDAYDPALESYHASEAPSTSRKSRGRTGSVVIAKQVMALASSLTREGDVITAHDISQTLGVSYDEARHLIALVSLGSGESADYLPVILNEQDDEVALMEGASMSARRIRLTQTEAIALMAALSEVGLSEDDPLMRHLSTAFVPQEFSLADIEQSLEQPCSDADADTLQICSNAIVQGRSLSFVYQPVTGGKARKRSVIPLHVRRTDDTWYLDAFDLQRQADRVFRIDHMDEVQVADAAQPVIPLQHGQEPHMVVVRFNNPHYLLIFRWEGLERLGTEGESVLVRMPYYGGTWLARHLAACAGTVQVSDRGLAEAIVASGRTL